MNAVIPFEPIQESGAQTLIGQNDQVDTNDYSASLAVELSPSPTTASGEVLAVTLISTEIGTGAVLQPTGTLLFFDADPAVTAGDTALTAAKWATLIGAVSFAATDWLSVDTAGAIAFKQVAIPFHALRYLYLVWDHTLATSYNDNAADDEILQVNFWYRRDS
jgi:hypothetical protein